MAAGARPPGLLRRLREHAAQPATVLAWTVIANDGIIATAGILEGFAGAGAGDQVLLLAATTATIAGMLGVGGSEWVEASVAREAQLALVEEERRELAADPAAELADLAAYYEERGLSPELAGQVAAGLTEHDALAAQLDSEHGIREVATVAETALVGVGSALAFGVGALVPLLITILVPVTVEAWAILGAVVLSLALTSVVTARVGRTRLWPTLARALAVGVGTLLVSYAVGLLVF